MADTVKVPGIGEVKTTYVYVAGALVAGIVGYAWWTRRGSSGSSAQPQWDVDSVGETSYVSPGGGSSYTAPPPAGTYTSNVEWANEALRWGQDHGYDTTMVTKAIALYLAKKPVGAKEADFLSALTPQIPPPPSGGPYSIIPDTAPIPGGVLPDLTRPGFDNQIPGSPWKYTIALPGETYADIGQRVYKGWGPSNPDYVGVIEAFRAINDHIKGPEPQAGDIVAYR